MEKFVGWWKHDKRYVTLIKSVLLAVLPVLCCVVYCAAQGRTISQVYLPGSEWNDELFYYKQVEGIIHFGYPQGYFGFNESHALKLSFAAWSPVLVFPWVLWGLLFGWNLMSPILCNIVLMTLCCFLFVWLVRPSWKQLGVLTLLFCLFRPFVRYMLAGMPETICFVMLILFYGLAINYIDRERAWKLALLLMMGSVMTLMRPYLLLCLLLPMYLWVRKSKWKGVIGSGLVLLLTGGLYVWIKHYLGAEYFAPLFFTDWAEAFVERGLFGGVRFTLGKLYYMGIDFMRHIRRGFQTGLASGAFFSSYLVMLCILLVQGIRDFMAFRRGRKTAGTDQNCRQLIVEVHLAFSFVAMLFALLLMYKLTEGSKHLLTFMAAGIFVVALMETRFYQKAVLLGITFVYFFSYMAVDPYDYQVPFVDRESSLQLEEWSDIFEGNLELAPEAPSFDNVVIWVFCDTVSGEDINTPWQMLYGLPEGFGISCCMPDYVLENIGELRSRYLCVTPGGPIEAACVSAGYVQIAKSDVMVLFQAGE